MKYLTALLVVLGLSLPMFAAASGSLTTTPIYPSDTVVPGLRVSFIVLPSGLTYPYAYRVVDSFGGGANNSNVDSAGNFVWTPNLSQVGSHVISVTVTDAQGATANTSVTLTVLPGPTLTVAATSSATVGYPLAFAATTTGLFAPTYTVGDSFRNSSLRTGAVDYSYTLHRTPIAQDVGLHTITVTAKDSFGDATSTSFDINVAPVGAPATATGAANTTTSAGATTGGSVTGSLFWSQLGAQTQPGPAVPAPAAPTAATSAQSNYTFGKFLTVGSAGADVTALQTLLTKLGFYSGPVTGYFGNLTKAGLAAYQGAHGIDAVGYAGPMTRAALSQGK